LFSNLLDGQLVKTGQILQNLLKTISTATASRDLHQDVKMGLLKRSGDKRTSVYQFNAIKEQYVFNQIDWSDKRHANMQIQLKAAFFLSQRVAKTIG